VKSSYSKNIQYYRSKIYMGNNTSRKTKGTTKRLTKKELKAMYKHTSENEKRMRTDYKEPPQKEPIPIPLPKELDKQALDSILEAETKQKEDMFKQEMERKLKEEKEKLETEEKREAKREVELGDSDTSSKGEAKKEETSKHAFKSDYSECPICLEEFTTEPDFTKCGHAFCQKCLKAALNIKPFCPLCRAPQNSAKEESVEEVCEGDWNPTVVRAKIYGTPDEKGYRNVQLSDGSATRIFVHKNAKIHVSPTTNLIINGKRVEHPEECSQQ